MKKMRLLSLLLALLVPAMPVAHASKEGDWYVMKGTAPVRRATNIRIPSNQTRPVNIYYNPNIFVSGSNGNVPVIYRSQRGFVRVVPSRVLQRPTPRPVERVPLSDLRYYIGITNCVGTADLQRASRGSYAFSSIDMRSSVIPMIRRYFMICCSIDVGGNDIDSWSNGVLDKSLQIRNIREKFMSLHGIHGHLGLLLRPFINTIEYQNVVNILRDLERLIARGNLGMIRDLLRVMDGMLRQQ